MVVGPRVLMRKGEPTPYSLASSVKSQKDSLLAIASQFLAAFGIEARASAIVVHTKIVVWQQLSFMPPSLR